MSNHLEIERVIELAFIEVLASTGTALSTPLTRDTVLLRSGLDSLGFAILVAKLEETLGYDPFVLAEQAIYPRTYGEFLDLYSRFESHRS
jgi:hypothetical protein